MAPTHGRRFGGRTRWLYGLGLVAVATAWVTRHEPRSWAPRALAAAAAPAAAPVATEATSKCQELQAEHMETVRSRIAGWEKASSEGRSVLRYGKQASQLLNRTLSSFDAAAREKLQNGCDVERQALEQQLQKQLYSIFLEQRSIVEQVLYTRLKKDLLRRMRRKKRELSVKEKLKLLHQAMADYDDQVAELCPFFVANPERDRAERRLSELQWGIADTPEGKEMKQRWKMDRLRRAPTRQSRDIAISLSPGMRLMLRPSGLGNFQLFSRRKVGPTNNPNEVAFGIHNDGKVIDVYNDQPHPPLIKFQPTIAIELSAS